MINQQKEQLRKLFARSPIWAVPATVNSIEGHTCTVTFFNTSLTVSEVSLYAPEKTGKPANRNFVAFPRVGALVTVTAFAGKTNELFIGGIMEFDRLTLADNYQLIQSPEGVYLTHADGRTVILNAATLNRLF